ncbi:L-seryl-tRNA(Sec) selenium transferase [Nitriliruptor alkaliphilus]|uniref:L-seryl-tRNA(Sec) selenium transferase n=1 Tax=Nitriliruptor alkaliphilus TaxID=427918 RepID=UPI00069654AE|nr:L-seryl-tRNA(Sec) selenium transferase [Nitriliruptor alkaliphilus]
MTDLRAVPEPPDPRAALPQVDAVVRSLPDLVAEAGHASVTAAVRAELDHLRAALAPGGRAPDVGEVAAAAERRVRDARSGGLVAVVNATGVVLHTGLGRAPLSAAAREAIQVAAGYSSVELDLATGDRGSRTAHLGGLAASACGTEAATVVNNGAGALLLVLAALAGGREVVVSRGELVEIGGSYRLPDVMQAAGVTLVEVGTTNRTRLADHRDAAGPDTGLLLKVHRSNFAIVGFTEDTPLADLVGLGRELDVPVVHDLGSGLLVEPPAGSPLAGEPSVAASVAAGADLVVISGDKLLGGPQAGIIAGRADLVATCARHPLARALRIDALQRAALEATLAAHLRDPVPHELPTVAMLHTTTAELRSRAERLAAACGDGAEAVATTGRVGGGSLPTRELPSWAVALDGPADALSAALRQGHPPVLGRITGDRLLLDLRTVPPAGDEELVALVAAARERAGVR